MPTEPLSGRALEIATAKALGWRAEFRSDERRYDNVLRLQIDGGWVLVRPSGSRGSQLEPTESEAWDLHGPYPLTDLASFETVMAALDELGQWALFSNKPLDSYLAARLVVSREGETRQIAACRLLVALAGEESR